MPCEMCRKRGKTWEGSNPSCAFEHGAFKTDNWNCATANGIREICYEGQNPMPPGVDYQYCDDEKYATIFIDHVESKNGGRIGNAMWVQWYKSRGETKQIIILDGDGGRPATEDECIRVMHHYSRYVKELKELLNTEQMRKV